MLDFVDVVVDKVDVEAAVVVVVSDVVAVVSDVVEVVEVAVFALLGKSPELDVEVLARDILKELVVFVKRQGVVVVVVVG